MGAGKYMAGTWVSSILGGRTKTTITAVVAASAMAAGTMAVNPLTANAEESVQKSSWVGTSMQIWEGPDHPGQKVDFGTGYAFVYSSGYFENGGQPSYVSELVQPDALSVGWTPGNGLASFDVQLGRGTAGDEEWGHLPVQGDSFEFTIPSGMELLDPVKAWQLPWWNQSISESVDASRGWPIRSLGGVVGYCDPTSSRAVRCVMDRDLDAYETSNLSLGLAAIVPGDIYPRLDEYTTWLDGQELVYEMTWTGSDAPVDPTDPTDPTDPADPGDNNGGGFLDGLGGILLGIVGVGGVLAAIAGIIGWLVNSGLVAIPGFLGLPKF